VSPLVGPQKRPLRRDLLADRETLERTLRLAGLRFRALRVVRGKARRALEREIERLRRENEELRNAPPFGR
jgi:hypothetical protein